MTKRYNNYRIVISSLRNIGGEKEQELAEEEAAIKRDRKELDVLREEVIRNKQQLAKEKSEFKDIIRIKEAQQLLRLQEEKAKLKSEHNKQYTKRIEDLTKATKKSQDNNKKKILDLQNKNNELIYGLEEQRRQLKNTEKRYKDIEKLRSLSKAEAEDLSQRLKIAENKFGLCANSTKYLHVSKYSKPRETVLLILYSQSEFLKIHNDVQAISRRYTKQIKVDI